MLFLARVVLLWLQNGKRGEATLITPHAGSMEGMKSSRYKKTAASCGFFWCPEEDSNFHDLAATDT